MERVGEVEKQEELVLVETEDVELEEMEEERNVLEGQQ